jgi:lipoyl-dependent peroxiredoxin subunit C
MGYILGVGEQFPYFEKKAVVAIEAGQEFAPIVNNFSNTGGQWAVMFWWPKDFSGLCPTELIEFNKVYMEFVNRNATLIGASTDSEFVHLAWRKSHDDLRDVRYPMLADTSKSLATELGILGSDDQVAYRATYIIDPDNVIRWLCVNPFTIGRNIDEVLRVLDALQTNKLCACNWKKGDDTLS